MNLDLNGVGLPAGGSQGRIIYCEVGRVKIENFCMVNSAGEAAMAGAESPELCAHAPNAKNSLHARMAAVLYFITSDPVGLV